MLGDEARDAEVEYEQGNLELSFDKADKPTYIMGVVTFVLPRRRW